MKIDFTITYPCFVPMRDPAEPWTFSSGDDKAVAIHSDPDLLNQFLSMGNAALPYYRRTCNTKDDLVAFLKEQKRATSKALPITLVAIDPTDLTRYVRSYPIDAFIDHVTSEE